MSDSYLPYQDPASTDHKLDTEQLAVGANTVERERMQIAGAANNEIARVLRLDPVYNDFKLVVQDVNSSLIASLLGALNISTIGGNTPAQGAELSPGVLRVMHVTDVAVSTQAIGTTMVVGEVVADAADTGGAPVKIGGIARSANPTAVADGDRVSASYDPIGRQIIRQLQMRGLLSTAYATLTTGTETSLLASGAGVFNDLVYIMGANTSSNAIQVDIRDGTAGGVVMTLYIPATSTAGVAVPVPIPQNVAAQTWTADMGDFTNTTVYISALFSKEV